MNIINYMTGTNQSLGGIIFSHGQKSALLSVKHAGQKTVFQAKMAKHLAKKKVRVITVGHSVCLANRLTI